MKNSLNTLRNPIFQMYNFKPCFYFPSRYLVSDCGKVYSMRSMKILKTHFCKQGYEKITLSLEKNRKSCKVHRLVLLSHRGEDEKRWEVNHIDGDKKNNKLLNLEWVTAYENTRHAVNKGLHNNVGENNGFAKFREEEIREMKYNLNTPMEELCSRYGVSKPYIYAIRRGERWKHV